MTEVRETSKQAYNKAKKNGVIGQNKYRMLKAVILYNKEHDEWPTAKQAFKHLTETNEYVDPTNLSAYQPRLTDELEDMGFVEEDQKTEKGLTWKPTQKGLQALTKAEQGSGKL